MDTWTEEIQGGIIALSNQWVVGTGEQERRIKDGAHDSGLSTEWMADPGRGDWTSFGEYHSSALNGEDLEGQVNQIAAAGCFISWVQLGKEKPHQSF